MTKKIMDEVFDVRYLNINYQLLAEEIISQLRWNEAIVGRTTIAEVETMKEDLLSGTEAAELLGCSRANITALRKAKRLRYTVVGKVKKYPYSEVLRIKRAKYGRD